MPDRLAALSARFLADRERLFAYLFALVRSRQVAEDLFQDTYLTLADAVARDIEIADLAAWCRGVARNLALRHWSGRRETAPASAILDAIDLGFADAHDDREGDLLDALAECRSQLPSEAAALLDQRYRQELPLDEIARRSRRSERGLITALARIRRRLQDCIEARLARAGHA